MVDSLLQSVPPETSSILILDFGSQFTQVIARRIRECQIYSEILPFHTPVAEILARNPKGIILSGGPNSVYAEGAPHPDRAIFECGLPILGICYGLQVMAHFLGGSVETSTHREFGHGILTVEHESPLFAGLGLELAVWNSHGDKVTKLPDGFRAVGSTQNSGFAAVEDSARRFYGLQFHPEVSHTPRGLELIKNFCYGVCGCSPDWTMGSFIERSCAEIRAQVGSDKVILGLSGGVDSSVAAALLHKAIGEQLTCIFVNNGLLRANEAEAVKKLFGGHFKINLKYVDASDLFVDALAGVTDPERKRKIIGGLFIDVFVKATEELRIEEEKGGATGSHYRFLAQGTLYPDVIESVSISGNPAALIKSHHNVGGLPEDLQFELVEPLRALFKDEVRRVGSELGLPKEIVMRQPFPGPGLAVRIPGEITRERLEILRNADEIVLQMMKAEDLYYQAWQSFAVLLPVRSVGVMGDARTYDYTIALRVVESQDGMTADWMRLPYDFLARLSNRIINEVKGVNRVVLDISSKPPSTIEWE